MLGPDRLLAFDLLPCPGDALNQQPAAGRVFLERQERIIDEIQQLVVGMVDVRPLCPPAPAHEKPIQQVMMIFDQDVGACAYLRSPVMCSATFK